MIWSIINAKGGVGKTTAAILLAAALHETGRMVRVKDADPQGSASSWAECTLSNADPLGFPVEPANKATLQHLVAGPEEVVIIDTPPGNGDIITAAIRAADLVIIPTDTSGLDMARTWETHDAAAGTPRVVLLSKAEPNTSLFKEGLDLLANDSQTQLVDHVIPKRQVIKRAYGCTPEPETIAFFADVADELLEMMS